MIILIFNYFYSCAFGIILMCYSIVQWLTDVEHIITQHLIRKHRVWTHKSVFYITYFIIKFVNA